MENKNSKLKQIKIKLHIKLNQINMVIIVTNYQNKSK